MQKVKNNDTVVVYKLAKAGAFSIGVVYVLMGVMALLSLMQVRSSGADEQSVLALIEQIPLGKIVVGLVFFGLLAYIVWKFYNAWNDPYGYGKSLKGVGKRMGTATAGLAYGLIAYSAITVVVNETTNTGSKPTEQQLLIAKLFQWGAGEWLVGLLATLVALTGIAQFVYVFKKGYREKLSVSIISSTQKKVINVLAWVGHIARGIILLIIAYFLFRASFQSDSSEVVNTEKAFKFLDNKVGHWSFIVVAIGTICYGFYMFALSLYYDFEDDF